MKEPLVSFFAAFLLSTADAAALSWVILGLGKSKSQIRLLLTLVIVVAKFGVLALGIALSARASWFRLAPFALGLAVPFLALVLVKGGAFKRQTSHG